MGVTNQEFINRAPSTTSQARVNMILEHDPRNDVLASATRAEKLRHDNVRRHLRGNGV